MAEEKTIKKNENFEINEIIEEIKNSDDETLKNTIEKWFSTIRTKSIRIGAVYISAAIFEAIKKHLKKGNNASLRDYKRMTDDIWKIISIQLKQSETQQNDSENSNDGTAEESEE